MAMLACSAEACKDILDNFRAGNFEVEDCLLTELAENYALEALIDIDLREIMDILEMSGLKVVLRGSFRDVFDINIPVKNILMGSSFVEMDSSTVAALLVVIKTNYKTCRCIWDESLPRMRMWLAEEFLPAGDVGLALYVDDALGDVVDLVAVLLVKDKINGL